MSNIIEKDINEGYIRLHVTPFRPDLLNTYLGPSLTPLARNISYHTVQTSPDKGFGYVELPIMEATKLKKKLNGAILKGQKIRIEEARHEKRKRPSEDEAAIADEDVEKKNKKKAKKAKLEDGVVAGYELEDGRKVKRGWTETLVEKRQDKESKRRRAKDQSEKESKENVKKAESKEKIVDVSEMEPEEKIKDKAAEKKKKKKHGKVREASKYTGEPECLFRTILPPNIAVSEGEEKKNKKDKKKNKREVVIHEFSKTKKHITASFLKASKVETGGTITQEYVDGKGWVDRGGNVLEGETEKEREKQDRRERKERKAERKAEAASHIDTLQNDNFSTHAEDESAIEPSEAHAATDAAATDDSSESATTGTAALDSPKDVHPLEALFKRPILPALDIVTNTALDPTFNFFGGDNDSDIDEDTTKGAAGTQPNTEEQDVLTEMIPQTPFTAQDQEWRETRSAAPTPDTAAIGKRFSFSFMGHVDEDEDDDDDEVSTGQAQAGASEGLGITNDEGAEMEKPTGERGEESEFAKWFYDHRSENNKKWRARRREAMKVKRKRENRRLTRRIV